MKSAFHVSRKKNDIFGQERTHNLWYLKSFAQSPAFICPLNFLFCPQQKTRCFPPFMVTCTPCHGHATRQQNQQNHGSQFSARFSSNFKFFFLITRRINLENRGSRLLMKSRFKRNKSKPFHIFTGKRLNHSRITKIPFTTFDLWLLR